MVDHWFRICITNLLVNIGDETMFARKVVRDDECWRSKTCLTVNISIDGGWFHFDHLPCIEMSQKACVDAWTRSWPKNCLVPLFMPQSRGPNWALTLQVPGKIQQEVCNNLTPRLRSQLIRLIGILPSTSAGLRILCSRRVLWRVHALERRFPRPGEGFPEPRPIHGTAAKQPIPRARWAQLWRDSVTNVCQKNSKHKCFFCFGQRKVLETCIVTHPSLKLTVYVLNPSHIFIYPEAIQIAKKSCPPATPNHT